VLTQFLVEAVVLSIAGGAVGILLGLGASIGVSRILQWSTDVTLRSVVMSFGVAAATGVFFGLYPARKASALDPIDALRSSEPPQMFHTRAAGRSRSIPFNQSEPFHHPPTDSGGSS
jgi:predicted lysophospholipase L1 biosynthesis ABC-type transport system permease subunit